jgi:hypothetical protein
VFVWLAGAGVIAVLTGWIGRTLAHHPTAAAPRRAAVSTSTTAVPPASTAADISDFLAAERRMLTSTWAIHAQFVRLTPSGRKLVSDLRRAQRPPDTLSEGPATADIRRNGRAVACAAGPTGGLVCKDAGPAPPFTGEVDSELGSLRSYLVAPLPLYRVGPAPGAGPGLCWRLQLAAPRYPSPPYGTQAVFCFDPATGAPSYSQVVRPEATDTTQALSITAAVSDADLRAGPGSGPDTQPGR